MSNKAYTVSLGRIAREETLRMDANYIMDSRENAYDHSYSFTDIFEFVEDAQVNIARLLEFDYAEINHVDANEGVNPIHLSFEQRCKANEGYFKKIEQGKIIKPEIGDILISKVRPANRKIIYISENLNSVYFTSDFIHIRPRRNGKILFYALKSIFLPRLVSVARYGKGYPSMSVSDLKRIKFLRSDIDALERCADDLLFKIESIEERIQNEKQALINESQLIDLHFKKFHGLDSSLLEHSAVRQFRVNLSDLSTDADLRIGCRYNSPSRNFALSRLSEISHKRLADVIAVPCKLGSQISPDEYDEAGTYSYVSMATFSKWVYDDCEAKRISDSFVEKVKSNDPFIQENDVVIARSGEGTIGKCAIIDSDCLAVFADFVIRIRFSPEVNPRFMYYYFRTSYFQHLIECYKKGLGNNTNIFPSQLKQFPVLDVSYEQQVIEARVLDSAMGVNADKRSRIAKLRKEIDELLYLSVK